MTDEWDFFEDKPKEEKPEKKESKPPTPKPTPRPPRTSSLEKKLDLLLEKFETKNFLDIELTEENLLREFKTVDKWKPYELKRIFRNNSTKQISKMLYKLLDRGILKKTPKNNWWYLA